MSRAGTGTMSLARPRTACITVLPPVPLAVSAEPRLQQLLGEFGALAAVCLRLAEELGHFVVARPLGVRAVLLEAERVAETLLHEPDQVVVLVLGAGDLAGFLRHADLLDSWGATDLQLLLPTERGTFPGKSADS